MHEFKMRRLLQQKHQSFEDTLNAHNSRFLRCERNAARSGSTSFFLVTQLLWGSVRHRPPMVAFCQVLSP